MLKIYSIITTLIIAIAPTLVYFLYTQPVEELINNQNEQLVKAKWEIERLEPLMKTNIEQTEEIEELSKINNDQAAQLTKKDWEIKELDENFKKLFEEEEKLKASAAKANLINDGDNLNKEKIKSSIEYDAINFVGTKQLWNVWVPFIQWSNLPSLRKLYETTSNNKIKEIIDYSCPKEYFQNWQNRWELVASALERAYCPWWKIESCDENTKKRINKAKSETWTLSTIWFHLITKYNKDNPADFSQRSILYYDQYWKRVCSWMWTKSWDKESYLRLK